MGLLLDRGESRISRRAPTLNKAPTHYLANFSRKLHRKNNNFDREGGRGEAGAHKKIYYLDLPLRGIPKNDRLTIEYKSIMQTQHKSFKWKIGRFLTTVYTKNFKLFF